MAAISFSELKALDDKALKKRLFSRIEWSIKQQNIKELSSEIQACLKYIRTLEDQDEMEFAERIEELYQQIREAAAQAGQQTIVIKAEEAFDDILSSRDEDSEGYDNLRDFSDPESSNKGIDESQKAKILDEAREARDARPDVATFNDRDKEEKLESGGNFRDQLDAIGQAIPTALTENDFAKMTRADYDALDVSTVQAMQAKVGGGPIAIYVENKVEDGDWDEERRIDICRVDTGDDGALIKTILETNTDNYDVKALAKKHGVKFIPESEYQAILDEKRAADIRAKREADLPRVGKSRIAEIGAGLQGILPFGKRESQPATRPDTGTEEILTASTDGEISPPSSPINITPSPTPPLEDSSSSFEDTADESTSEADTTESRHAVENDSGQAVVGSNSVVNNNAAAFEIDDVALPSINIPLVLQGETPEQDRLIVKIADYPFYRSSGTSSGQAGTFFPFSGLSDMDLSIIRIKKGGFIKPMRVGIDVAIPIAPPFFPEDIGTKSNALITKYNLKHGNGDETFDFGRFGNMEGMVISYLIGGGFWQTDAGQELGSHLEGFYKEYIDEIRQDHGQALSSIASLDRAGLTHVSSSDEAHIATVNRALGQEDGGPLSINFAIGENLPTPTLDNTAPVKPPTTTDTDLNSHTSGLTASRESISDNHNFDGPSDSSESMESSRSSRSDSSRLTDTGKSPTSSAIGLFSGTGDTPQAKLQNAYQGMIRALVRVCNASPRATGAKNMQRLYDIKVADSSLERIQQLAEMQLIAQSRLRKFRPTRKKVVANFYNNLAEGKDIDGKNLFSELDDKIITAQDITHITEKLMEWQKAVEDNHQATGAKKMHGLLKKFDNNKVSPLAQVLLYYQIKGIAAARLDSTLSGITRSKDVSELYKSVRDDSPSSDMKLAAKV